MARTPVTAPLIEFYIIINKDRWKVRLYTGEGFNKKWINCIGVTDYDHKKDVRTINFKGPASSVSKDTVAHELMHAFLSYRDYSRLKPETFEECICELMGKKYKNLYTLTEKVYNMLTRDRNEIARDAYFRQMNKK